MQHISKCNTHGLLKISEVYKKNKRGSIYYQCRKCAKISKLKSSLRNRGVCPIHGKIDIDLVRKDGRCKLCHRTTANQKRNNNRDAFNKKMHEDKLKNPEKWKEIYKKAYLQNKAKYRENYSLKKCCDSRRITIQKYNDLLEAQNNNCAICLQPETRKMPKSNLTMRLTIDHCHKTNTVRGLLCHSCNTGIGKLKEDFNIVLRAARYVKLGGFIENKG